MPVDEGNAVGGSFKRVASIYLFNLAISVILFQSMLLSIFTPLPQIYCYLRLGRWAGITMPLIVFTLTGIAGWGAGLGYLIQFGITGAVISEAIIRRYSIEKGFAFATSIPVILALLTVFTLGVKEGIGAGEFVGSFAERVIGETITLNEKAGISLEQISDLKRLSPVVVDFVSDVYPSLMTIGVMLTLWLNLLVLARFMRQSEMPPPFGDLSAWKAPEYMVWGVIAGGVAVVSGVEILKIAGINILVVIFVVFFFQGMAIISYFFRKRRVPYLLKGIGYLFAVWYMSVVVAIIGLFDLWADFRRLAAQKGQNAS